MSGIETGIPSALSPGPLGTGQGRSLFRRRGWAYDRPGVLVRVVADSLLANLGLLFGFLVTLLCAAFLPTQDVNGLRSFVYGWLATAPMFTLLCYLALAACGMYTGSRVGIRPQIVRPFVGLAITDTAAPGRLVARWAMEGTVPTLSRQAAPVAPIAARRSAWP